MLMVVNPVIEVYLLDSNGVILAFSAPPGKVKRQSVSLGPVKRLLSGTAGLPVLGDDPRDLRQKKVFSVAPISLKGRTEGYLYIILGGEEFETEAQMLRGSYILRLSIGAAAGGLLFALLAALLLFNRMTRRLRLLATAMETFRQRDFSEPLDVMHGPSVRLGDEIDRIGMVFTHMADRITEQIRALKKADKQRREFTANIAHDLRTPLASLLGYLETLLMKEGKLTPEERRDYLTTSIKRSEQLGKLVNALFELATLDSPDVRVRFEPFSLAELVHDILQKYRLSAETRKVRLELDAAEELPLVYAEIGLCERIFENLIDNALRHTPEGGLVRVAARRVKSSELGASGLEKTRFYSELKTQHSELDDDFIEISVIDTGSGIPPEDLPHLFDRFSRRARSRAVSPAGAGLGLAIVKRILELHGSGINVSSAVNAGTTFTFALPVHQPQP
jgi:signal transduction histidine kinase